jgi:hemerythrin-like domain-containing protein
MMSFYDTLKKEHQAVKGIIQQIRQGKGNAENLLSRLQQELSVHMNGEEKLFYSILSENESAKEKAFEACEEHHVARTVLQELQDLPTDNERWMAKLQVFQEILEHHIEEEENEIFEVAQEVISREQENRIASQYEEMKQQQMAAAR